MSRFDIELPWEIDDGVTIDLIVSGSYDSSPGNRRGHPDTWTQPWSELDVDSIKNERGCPLPPSIAGELRADNRFLQEVERRING